ncbi:hypothetical protein [Umezawaea sp.]|uniref:hypothetical protein n=1 Tax=Umezawaea sp. TaxID=1955258 RepID=UPI002ED10D15
MSTVPVLVAAVFSPVVAVLPLAVAFGLFLRHRPARAGAVLAAATPMFGIGTALLGLDLLPRPLALGALAFDLVLFGVAVAVADAFDEGEAVRADLVRSLVVSLATAILFGAQVVVVMVHTEARLEPLLFGTVAAAIAVQVLASPISAVADRLVLPGLAKDRAELRGAIDALPRRNPLADVDVQEFAKLTRRALSHYGDLGKLVASPLTDLPVITDRLAARGAVDQPVERAVELKALLLESVTRLKPRDGDFGTSDEWRHYNALYFYYVAGIRPYSVRTKREDLDPPSRRALAWFVGQVPERTLHNWQNAGAKLVAADLFSQVESR